jgi:gamma-glutamylcyclotransferase (GGCT)/AIG2-like uncharacterized protein YtfP
MKVFVYGTLKRGYGNHHILADSRFVGEGETVARCRLFNSGFPVLRRRLNLDGPWNAPVRGEIYEVTNPETLARLDRLESEGFMYHRRIKKIRTDDGQIVKAHTYIGDARRFRNYEIYPAPQGAYNWQKEKPQWHISEQPSSEFSRAE